MQLAYALLADAAEVAANGKVSMLGGDFDTIFTPSFPALHDKLSIVIKLLLQPAETGIEHRFRVEFTDPDGDNVLPPAVTTFTVSPPGADDEVRDSNELVRFLFVIALPFLVFTVAGTYLLRFYVNDDEVGAHSLYLKETPKLPASALS